MTARDDVRKNTNDADSILQYTTHLLIQTQSLSYSFCSLHFPEIVPSMAITSSRSPSLSNLTPHNPQWNKFVLEPAKKPAGLSSILLTVKPLPVSRPFEPFKPVVNGPVKQPTLTLFLSSPTGFGNARRGGPEASRAASWMWVAVLAGDW